MVMLLRWGICGAGATSTDFAKAISLLPPESHKIVAVGSSSESKSEKFAINLNLDKVKCYGGYEKVFENNDVDIVYIGLLNHQHKETVIRALNKGKHVVCEKPLGLNPSEVRDMVEAAKKNHRFLLEGYWSKFFPVYDELHKEIQKGTIGDPLLIEANIGYASHAENKMVRAFGGGGMMATGCYLPMFAMQVFGTKPTQISCVGTISQAAIYILAFGVDDTVAISLKFGDNQIAQLTSSCSFNMVNGATIYGSNGKTLKIPDHMWCPTQLTTPDTHRTFEITTENLQFKYPNAAGFKYEIEAVRQCILNGLVECPKMTWQNTIDLSEVLYECRKQLGVVYDQD